jgi:hypothetical protein
MIYPLRIIIMKCSNCLMASIHQYKKMIMHWRKRQTGKPQEDYISYIRAKLPEAVKQ